MHINGTEYAITPGFSVCFPPGPIQLKAGHNPRKPLQVFYCHFTLRTPSGTLLAHDPPPAQPIRIHYDALLRETVRRFAALSGTQTGSALREALLWQLLLLHEHATLHQPSLPSDRISTLTQQIRENPAAPWMVDALAQQAGMSSGHFRRVFQATTGSSPVQFILDCRIQRACYYLRETRLPVQQVATTTGYRDVYFFSRQFKERMGLSPSAYRARHAD